MSNMAFNGIQSIKQGAIVYQVLENFKDFRPIKPEVEKEPDLQRKLNQSESIVD